MTACPFCAEPLDDPAPDRCGSCGEFLGEREETARGGGARVVLILVAIVVLSLLGCMGLGVVTYVSRRRAMGMAMNQARAQANLQALSSAVELYRTDVGAYPTQLGDLVQTTGNPAWRGPYLADPWPPKDPWGNPFVYTLQGSRYVITSLGADGAPGGAGEAADLTAGN